MEMEAENITDYIGIPLHFTDGEIYASSWTTRQPGGFTDAQIEGLRAFIPSLTRIIEIVRLRRTAAGLLSVYVGPRAGERILAGQIRRGHTETMHAAIWLSDLRGFTALSDRLSPEAVVDILNQYFDCQMHSEHGGEVLKFMGDGLLAVFPIAEDEGDEAKVCNRVLDAARAEPSKRRGDDIREPDRDAGQFPLLASRSMSANCSMAIFSAAATGWTSPASVPPSISRRGWRRSRAASTARWSPPPHSRRPARSTGTISGNSRSLDFPAPSGCYGLRDETSLAAE